MTSATDEIGAAAQAVIERWIVASRGIHARPSLDSKGWDLFVQLPASKLPAGVPPDKRPGDVGFYLQSKGTTNIDTRGFKLNLSTAVELVKVPLAAVCVVLASPDNTFDVVAKAWVVPVDEALITRILKDLTEVHQAGESPSKDLWVPLATEAEVQPTRESVVARMVEVVERGVALHGAAKARIVETAGYETHPIGVKVGQVNVRQLALAALGLHELVDVSDIEITERRFDATRKHRHFEGDYHLRLGGGGATVEVAFGAQHRPMMPAQLRSTEQVFNAPPPTLRGIRIENRFIDLVLTDIPGTPSGFRAPPPIAVDESFSLRDDLVSFARNVRAIEAAIAREATTCPVVVNGHPYVELSLVGLTVPLFGPETDRLVQAILDAEEIARALDLPPDLSLTLHELLPQAIELGQMRAFLSGQTIPDLRAEVSDAGDESKLWVVPGSVAATLGGRGVCVLFTVSGRPKRIPGGARDDGEGAPITHTLASPRTTIEAKVALPSASGSALHAWLSTEAKRLSAKYAARSEDEILIVPDYVRQLIEPSPPAPSPK